MNGHKQLAFKVDSAHSNGIHARNWMVDVNKNTVVYLLYRYAA